MNSVTDIDRTSAAAFFVPAEADEPNENSIVARTAEVWEQEEARAEEEKVTKDQCGCPKPASVKERITPFAHNPQVALATAVSVLFVTVLIAYLRRPQLGRV